MQIAKKSQRSRVNSATVFSTQNAFREKNTEIPGPERRMYEGGFGKACRSLCRGENNG